MDVPAGDTDDLGVDEAFARESDFESIIAPQNWRPPGEYYQVMPAETRRTISAVVAADERLRKELRVPPTPRADRDDQMLGAGESQIHRDAPAHHALLGTGLRC